MKSYSLAFPITFTTFNDLRQWRRVDGENHPMNERRNTIIRVRTTYGIAHTENGAILFLLLLAAAAAADDAVDGWRQEIQLSAGAQCTMLCVYVRSAKCVYLYGITYTQVWSCNRTKMCWHRNEIDQFVADGFNFPLVILHIQWT